LKDQNKWIFSQRFLSHNIFVYDFERLRTA